MLETLKLYAATLPIFLAIDMIWLGVIMAGFYNSELGALARRSGEALAPHWPSALLVYFLIPLGIVLYVVPKGAGDPLATALWGALFGLILYGVYDLTNYATLAGWPARLVVVDMLWGAVVCGIVALIASYIAPLMR
ncbi:DUF2177 domain-containing protein [Candidatus Gracilibacteria bacterium CG17_big_fil_post_rev_8_21_14_2_50_48_13]|nr:MAG: DUF2177 domain-containing protein [Candidatus Gracilibacteria bacterium CG17_big_fil_post_rev_8_21_14_2_50_48_13]